MYAKPRSGNRSRFLPSPENGGRFLSYTLFAIEISRVCLHARGFLPCADEHAACRSNNIKMTKNVHKWTADVLNRGGGV